MTNVCSNYWYKIIGIKRHQRNARVSNNSYFPAMFQLSCLILVSVTIAAVAITKAEYSDREIEMKICGK